MTHWQGRLEHQLEAELKIARANLGGVDKPESGISKVRNRVTEDDAIEGVLDFDPELLQRIGAEISDGAGGCHKRG